MYRQWSLYVPPLVTICTAQCSLYAPSVVTIRTAQWSLYVPQSFHYMYRTVVTICTASGHYMYRTVVTICTASCHYTYRQWSLYVLPVVALHTASLIFSNSTLCPTQCIYVFCVDLRTNSHYFPELWSCNSECVQPQVGKLSFLASVQKYLHAVYRCVGMFVLWREDFVIQLSPWLRVTCLFAVPSVLSVMLVAKTWTCTCTINAHLSVWCMKLPQIL